MLVPVHVFVVGLNLSPVFRAVLPLNPPKTIISLPVQTAVWLSRAVGTLIMLVAVQASVEGVYLPPLSRSLPLYPPQTIISLPVQTAVWWYRAKGALVRLVAVQVSSVHGGMPSGISGRVYAASFELIATDMPGSPFTHADPKGFVLF